LAVVARLICQQRQQGVEQTQDVVQRRRLQLAGTVQVLIEGAERMLSGLTRGTELIQAVLAVEFLDGAELCGVGRIVQIAPVAQLAQGGIDFVDEECTGRRSHERCLYLRRPQREGKAGALGDEHRENGAIEWRFLGVQVSEDGVRLIDTR